MVFTTLNFSNYDNDYARFCTHQRTMMDGVDGRTPFPSREFSAASQKGRSDLRAAPRSKGEALSQFTTNFDPQLFSLLSSRPPCRPSNPAHLASRTICCIPTSSSASLAQQAQRDCRTPRTTYGTPFRSHLQPTPSPDRVAAAASVGDEILGPIAGGYLHVAHCTVQLRLLARGNHVDRSRL